MIAVLIQTQVAPQLRALGVLGFWFLTFALAALGVTWLLAARGVTVSPLAKRFIVAALCAVALSSTLGAVVCVACQNCDPWWLETFWICWPV